MNHGPNDNAKPRYTIIVEATALDNDGIPELRRALKRMLRAYGLRCLSVSEIPVEKADVLPGGDSGENGT